MRTGAKPPPALGHHGDQGPGLLSGANPTLSPLPKPLPAWVARWQGGGPRAGESSMAAVCPDTVTEKERIPSLRTYVCGVKNYFQVLIFYSVK